MSDRFEKDLRDHLHREAAQAKDLPPALPGRIRRDLDSGGRFTPAQQLAFVAAMLIFVAMVGFLVVQLKGGRTSLPGQHNQGELLPGFTCTDRTGGDATSLGVPTEYGAEVHGGYERLTFQFSGASVPAYQLKQQAAASFLSNPSGLPVTLKGSVGLTVVFRPRATPLSPSASSTEGVYRSDLIGIASAMPTDLTEISEVRLLGSPVSLWTFGVGLANRTCFRVTELANPARLAIDFDTSQKFSCASQQGGSATGGPFELKGIGVAPVQNVSSQSLDRLTFSFDSGVPPFAVIPQDSTTFSRYNGSTVTLLGSSGIRLKFGNVANTDFSKVYFSMTSGGSQPPTKATPTDFTPRLAAIQEVALLDNSLATIQYGVGLAAPTCFRVIEHDKTLEIDFQTPASVAEVPFQLQQLSFVDSVHGWALGTASKAQIRYLVLAGTSDGGATWYYLPFQDQSVANAAGDSWHIYFETPLVGWLYGPRTYRTADGGRTWLLNSLPGFRVDAIASSGSSVWAAGLVQGCIGTCPLQLEVSSDGGQTWTAVRAALIGPRAQLVRVSNLYGWILSWQQLQGGDSSSLAVTHDAGVTWQRLTTPCAPATSFEDRIAAIDDMNVWIVCGSQPGAGSQQKQLVTSTDGGFHWSQPPNPPSTGYVSGLALSGPTSGLTGWLATARGPLYLTADGGRTWQAADPRGVLADLAGSGALEVVFSDPLHGWAASATEIFRTSDGGLHWTGVPAEALE